MTVSYLYWSSYSRPWLVIELIADITITFIFKAINMFLGVKFINALASPS